MNPFYTKTNIFYLKKCTRKSYVDNANHIHRTNADKCHMLQFTTRNGFETHVNVQINILTTREQRNKCVWKILRLCVCVHLKECGKYTHD